MVKKRDDLKGLLKVIQHLSQEVDPQMTLLNLNAFLSTAVQDDVVTISDLRDALANYGGTRSNTSRNISYWTEESWRRPDGSRPPGLALVKTVQDPEDYRRKLLLMTSKGHAFCDTISELLES